MPPDDSHLVRSYLHAASAVLQAQLGGAAPRVSAPVTISSQDGRYRVEITVTEVTARPPFQIPPRPEADRPPLVMKDLHRRLLAAATAEPVKARTLVARTPYAYNSNTRQALTDLCRAGLLVRDSANRYSKPAASDTA